MHLGPHAWSFSDVLHNQDSCVSACDHAWPRKKRSPRCRLAAGMRRHATRLVSSSCCAPSLLPPSFPLEFAVIRMSVISPFNGDGTKKERRKGSHSYGARSALSLARSLASSNLGPAESFIYALRIRNRRRRALEFMKLLSRRAGVLPLCSLLCDPPILRPPLLSLQSRPP